MEEDIKTYQPDWGKKREHHHHRHRSSDRYTNTWGGWMKMRDKQAYYGLMLVVISVLAFGAYKLVKMVVNEFRSLPMDDPATERTVDELRIHKMAEQDALLYSDSLAKAENLDSIRRNVQIETRSVYRPPKREDKWYITQREWKAIWRDYKIMRWERKRAREERKAEKEAEKQ